MACGLFSLWFWGMYWGARLGIGSSWLNNVQILMVGSPLNGTWHTFILTHSYEYCLIEDWKKRIISHWSGVIWRLWSIRGVRTCRAVAVSWVCWSTEAVVGWRWKNQDISWVHVRSEEYSWTLVSIAMFQCRCEIVCGMCHLNAADRLLLTFVHRLSQSFHINYRFCNILVINITAVGYCSCWFASNSVFWLFPDRIQYTNIRDLFWLIISVRSYCRRI